MEEDDDMLSMLQIGAGKGLSFSLNPEYSGDCIP